MHQKIGDKDLTEACVALNAIGRNDLAVKLFDALVARRSQVLVSDSRIRELIDYITDYGEVNPDTPNGTITSAGTEFNDLWRDGMLALFELRDRRGITDNNGGGNG